jgi:hypothetical protein
MSRRVKVAVAVIGVGLAVNAAAARLDSRSGDARREAAERDVRARLVARGVRDARVECESGLSCTVTRPGAAPVQVDPRYSGR